MACGGSVVQAVESRVWHGTFKEARGARAGGRDRIPGRVDERRAILVPLVIQMDSLSADIAKRCNHAMPNITLHGQVVLHFVRSTIRRVVEAIDCAEGRIQACRTHRSARRWMREERNRGRPGKDHGLGRGILRIRVEVRSRGNWLVEDSETSADRRLMIREGVPSQTHARIEIQGVRVRFKNVMHLCKAGRGQWIQDRIARFSHADWVGLIVVSQTDIDCEVRPYFPIVLDVGEKLDLARVTCPREARMRIGLALELHRGACQKTRDAAEDEEPALAAHRDVVLNSGYGSADLETVSTVAPKEIIAAGELVLN